MGKRRNNIKCQILIGNTKQCSKCELFKDLSEYNRDKSKPTGRASRCISCKIPERREYYCKNKEVLNKKATERSRNCPKAKARKTKYAKSEKGRVVMARYRATHKTPYVPPIGDALIKKREANKRYRLRNKGKIKNSPRKISIPVEKRKQYRKTYYLKLKADPLRYMTHMIRIRLRDSIKRNIKIKTSEYIKFSTLELKTHLENQFKDGMSWDNYGRNGWHIDHIRPCASFDMNKKEDVLLCWSLDNLQPLWAKDNLKKGAKYLQ